MAPRQISELTSLDKGAVSRAVHSMRRRGLVEVRSGAGDHQRQSVALTPPGSRCMTRSCRYCASARKSCWNAWRRRNAAR
ncbi:MarR family transcriptional regulator [Afifella pfennigii]|uniref:MarR family transcriptional regulator n=1 Tax=Afifella pfennigii TaxID=209897 RepID=UPI00389902E3